MTDAVSIGLLLLAFVAAGVGLAFAAGLPLTREWLPTVLGLSPLLGLLVLGGVGSILAGSGIGIGLGRALVAAALVVGLAVVAARRSPPHTWPPRRRSQPVFEVVLEVMLVAVLVIFSAVLVATALVTPLEAWDGWAIWATHAHALFVDGDTAGPVFQSRLYANSHSEYPIALPVLEALVSQSIGRFDTEVIHLVPALFVGSVGLAAWGVLRTFLIPSVAALVGLAVVGSEALVRNALDNYADCAVGGAVAIGLLFLTAWVATSSTSALALGAACLAGAGLLKLEGLLFAIAAVAALVLVCPTRRRCRRALTAAAGIAIVPPLVGYALVGARAPDTNAYDLARLLGAGDLGDSWHRAHVSSTRMLDDLAAYWWLPLGALVCGMALCLLGRRYRVVAFVGLWSLLGLGGLVLTYVASTIEIEAHLDTSADRVVFSLALAAAAVAPLLAQLGWEAVRREATSDTG